MAVYAVERWKTSQDSHVTNPHHVWSVLECVVIESSNDDGSVSLGLGDSVGLATITCLLSVICGLH